MTTKVYTMAIALSIAIVLSGCTSRSGEKKPLAVRVETEQVSSQIPTESNAYVGQVEEQSATTVSYTSMGTLERVLVSEGQWVRRGQLIAVINDATAQSAMQSAKAQLDQAHDALERMRLLHDKGSLTDIKWVEIQSQVQQAEAQYRMMEKQVNDCRLVAPVSGVIGSGVMSAGESVVPAMPVARILNIDHVKVRVAIPEQEIDESKQVATITVDALGGEQFKSHSITRGVEGDLITHTYTIYANVSNPRHKLLPGMVCNVTFPVAGSKPVITVPARCVGQNPAGARFVWVVKDKKAHLQTVTVGNTTGNRLIITDGLKDGDIVITEGYRKVGENSEVII